MKKLIAVAGMILVLAMAADAQIIGVQKGSADAQARMYEYYKAMGITPPKVETIPSFSAKDKQPPGKTPPPSAKKLTPVTVASLSQDLQSLKDDIKVLQAMVLDLQDMVKGQKK